WMAKRKRKGRGGQRRPPAGPGGARSSRASTAATPRPAAPRPGAGRAANRARPGAAATGGRLGTRRRLARPLTIAISAMVLLGGYYGYLWLKSRQGPGPLE